VPLDWCKAHPEELLVYWEGPRDAEQTRSLGGPQKQDYLGYDAPNGYYQQAIMWTPVPMWAVSSPGRVFLQKSGYGMQESP
jgi:hypothetical protein